MKAFIIKSLLTLASLSLTIYSFATGHWGWGIVMILVSAIFIMTFLRNERMILAMNQMRVGNQDKAKYHINKITHPSLLPKRQHAYILYLQGIMNQQEYGFQKSETMLRKALTLGLRTKQDQAAARLHLANICAQTGRKQEATTLLAEAKKMDTQGMIREQANNLQKQMSAVPSKNQMRMQQMMGGRKKAPKRK